LTKIIKKVKYYKEKIMELWQKIRILNDKNEPTWTKFRIEIDKSIKNNNLKIIPLNITQWNKIEHKIINFFTGTNGGFTWMWENKILKKFDSYAKQIDDYEILEDIIKNNIGQNELLWIFLEDSINGQSKYWGYSGKIDDIIKLLGDIFLNDFYIVSKKLKWIIGQNHEDILFGYGEIAKKLEEYSLKKYEDKMGVIIYKST
jgi:hypothetical protein